MTTSVTFATAPPNEALIRYADANNPFLNLGTGDGTTTAFKNSYLTNTLSVYKSDWQGNQLQYSTPRTNNIWNTDLSTWANYSLVSVTTGQSDPSGGTNAVEIVYNTSSLAVLYSAATSSTDATYDIWLKGAIGGEIVSIGENTNQLTLPALTTSWKLYTISTSSNPVYGYVGIGNPNNIAQTIYAFAPMAQPVSNGGGSFIPNTTSSAVTVTDYSLASNTVTFSTAPLTGAIITAAVPLGTGDGSTTTFDFSNPPVYTPQIYVYDWQGNQLQYSTPRTNSCYYSQDLTNGDWVKRGTLTVTAETFTAPDGSPTSDLLAGIDTASVGDIYQAQFMANLPTLGTPIGASFWIYPVTTSGVFGFENSNNSNQGQWNINLALLTPSSWNLITPSHPAVSVINPFLSSGPTTATGGYFVKVSGTGTQSCYIWGINFGCYGSYIPTTSSPVTVTDYSLAGPIAGTVCLPLLF